ncbi:hypothetical protein B296_00036816 [Ensete ventricosum]|uniref:Uncharacterized protein n=1 Tax=Ensete ventricosum TaxID=4639 RepID=A0A426XE35_ENSVE|nr:hypothetical protein B296_00036816 [Ensete ventricosum]
MVCLLSPSSSLRAQRVGPERVHPGALLVFVFLRHQSLDGDVLVGSLQHLRYSCGGSLHKRPKKVGRPNLDHEILDDQRWMCIGNGPDFIYEAGEVLSEVFFLLLSHPDEGCGTIRGRGCGRSGCDFEAGLSNLVRPFLQDKTSQVVGSQGGPSDDQVRIDSRDEV